VVITLALRAPTFKHLFERVRRSAAPALGGNDREMSARQLLVLLCGGVAVLGLVSGVGLLGLPPVAESAGGALAADATLVAPGAGLQHLDPGLRRAAGPRPASRLEAVLLDGTVGLYLGWVTVATVANATALLEAVGLQAGGVAWGLAWVAVARTVAEPESVPVAVVAAAGAATVVVCAVLAGARSRR